MGRVVVGVAGGIAAYKACELVRRLRADNHEVRVVPTRAALKFVGATTWEALSGNPVSTEVWDDTDQVAHVRIGQEADLVVIAPATADLMARAASGRADDLLTNVLLTAHCPVVMAPAMHTEMWEHPATRANVATLRERGVLVIDPASGRLTGADSGPGRLPEAVEIHDIAAMILAEPEIARSATDQDLRGMRVVVSAGGTREHLDPVRYLGNASSGLMGIALARAAALRGAEVTLVAGHIEHPVPSGVEVRHVISTGDLAEAMTELAPNADLVIMAAAPADYTPKEFSTGKIKKSGDDTLAVEFEQTPDVLAGLVQQRAERGDQRQVLVGFAAETAGSAEALVELGTAKLRRKGCDLLVCNDVSSGRVFGAPDNTITVLNADGIVAEHTSAKSVVAHVILDAARRVGPRQ
ncbi:bifunctional phosphopantothenoylcysteine decarboxylase/phosphopantothenate--cysteine ligase CoaBC [Enemella sp. A6]|uniref:bifunctional phosphopantothenoylcysteine decarboxylase/phosphopantothenate--cysteine ligase CoaBC n=1 Tax=Enemella sp. A6 TaxID=3440152 RepID=UPI003EBA1B6A